MDVIWVPEFARAGWLRDISRLPPVKERDEFFLAHGCCNIQGQGLCNPLGIDAGLLYYRKDLLKKYGFSPPKTWHDLIKIAQQITEKEKDL